MTAGNQFTPSSSENRATVQPLDSSRAGETVSGADPSASDIWKACSDLALQPRILDHFEIDLEAAGIVGEGRAAKLLFLTLASRVLERPIASVVKGPSAAGKSSMTEAVLRFFPESSYYYLTAMSEKLLAYDTEPIAHRILVIAEAAGLQGEMGSYLLRSLLSEGRIRYKTLEKGKEGRFEPREILREGPTGLILTTTRVHVHPEVETRLLSIPVNDSPEQTRRVFRAAANDERRMPDFRRWHSLHTWLESQESKVTIPFAEVLAELMPAHSIRLRRDFPQLLTLIRTHALLHRATREIGDQGKVIAALEDFAVVRELMNDLLAHAIQASVPKHIRETVDAVSDLAAGGRHEVTQSAVGKRLGIDKGTASRRIRQAISDGYLKNLRPKRGMPMNLRSADPLPIDRDAIPTTEQVARALRSCAVALDLEGERGSDLPVSQTISESFEV